MIIVNQVHELRQLESGTRCPVKACRLLSDVIFLDVRGVHSTVQEEILSPKSITLDPGDWHTNRLGTVEEPTVGRGGRVLIT